MQLMLSFFLIFFPCSWDMLVKSEDELFFLFSVVCGSCIR